MLVLLLFSLSITYLRGKGFLLQGAGGHDHKPTPTQPNFVVLSQSRLRLIRLSEKTVVSICHLTARLGRAPAFFQRSRPAPI